MRAGLMAAVILAAGCYSNHPTEPTDAPSTDGGLDAPNDTGLDAPVTFDASDRTLPFVVDETTDPFCIDFSGANVVDVWSDALGLYVLVSDGVGRSQVWYGTRGSWALRLDRRSPAELPDTIVGTQEGEAFVFPTECSLWEVGELGAAGCVDVLGIDGATLRPRAAWLLARSDGWFFRMPAPGFADIAHYRGGVFRGSGEFELLEEPVGVWGDAVGAFVATSEGVYGTGSDSGPRTDVPAGTYVGLWGVDRDEIGVVTEDGRVLVLSSTGWTSHSSGLSGLRFVDRGPTGLAVAGERVIALGPPSALRMLRSWSGSNWTVAAIAAIDGGVLTVLEGPADECGPYLVVELREDGAALGW